MFLKRFFYFCRLKQVWIPVAVGILISLLSNLMGWDIAAQEVFYDAEEDRWTGQDMQTMVWLYLNGVKPAIGIALFGASIFLLGFNVQRLRIYRRVALFLLLVLVIGNGLVANAILKEYWGRPRPSQVDQFGGTQAFEPSLWIHTESSGKSFPSGHATMGFYFFALALLLRGKARLAVFAFTIAFGSIIGLSRISYGGHFFTDVVWAGIIMWLISLGFYRFMEIEQNWRYERPQANNFELTPWQKVRGRILVPLATVAILGAATRFPRDKSDHLTVDFQGQESVQIELERLKGDIKIATGAEELRMMTHCQGFGLPKTRLRLKSDCEIEEHSIDLSVRHHVQGFFTELRATTRIELPNGAHYILEFDPEKISWISIDGELVQLTGDGLVNLDLR